jgi:hypothetical protein
MDGSKTHRYRIWEFAGRSTPNAKTDDLRALVAHDPGLAIELELEAIFASPGGQSVKCKTKSISPEVVDVVYDANDKVRSDETLAGASIQMDINALGSIRGLITSETREGFSTRVDDDFKPMLKRKLHHFLKDTGLPADEDRILGTSRIARIEPNVKSCTFADEQGILRKGMVVNVSRVDALIRATHVPRLASKVIFSGSPKRAAEIARTFEIGFVAKFCVPIPDGEFSEAIQFLSEATGDDEFAG